MDDHPPTLNYRRPRARRPQLPIGQRCLFGVTATAVALLATALLLLGLIFAVGLARRAPRRSTPATPPCRPAPTRPTSGSSSAARSAGRASPAAAPATTGTTANASRRRRFVERALTAVQTLRLQGRDVLDYLCRAVEALRAGSSAPRLVYG